MRMRERGNIEMCEDSVNEGRKKMPVNDRDKRKKEDLIR